MPDTAQLKEAITTLTGILQKQQDLGKERTLLSKSHLDILEGLPQKISQMNPLPVPVAPAPPSLAPAKAISPSSSAKSSANDNAYLARGIECLMPEGKTKRERLNHLAKMVKMDTQCQSLGTLRETMVFASGNPDAKLMLVGEAPGSEEEAQHKPFVGPAGQLLDKILGAMGLSRQDVYVSNIVKFRPQVAGSGDTSTEHRKPHRDEIKNCLKFIMAEIDVVQPAVIVALGGTAANALLDNQEPVGSLREQNHSLKAIPVIVTYHPSYLLHCESSSPGKFKAEKRKVWNDMKSAMEKLGQPSQS
ncbi:MAG: uracil-DNA glycosylase [Verrucomicrobia bacterium]|nr:uracil-DNA glycosylase [Verrucomicrobiota bacterium]